LGAVIPSMVKGTINRLKKGIFKMFEIDIEENYSLNLQFEKRSGLLPVAIQEKMQRSNLNISLRRQRGI